MAALLADLAREVVMATTLAEARTFATDEPFDIAFVEDYVADGRALELIPALSHASPHLLAVVMTDRATVDSTLEHLRGGVHDYLLKPFTDQTRIRQAIARASDKIAVRKQQQELVDRLATSEERLALALKATSEGLWDWDLARNYIYLSQRWKTMLGYAEEEIGNSPDEWFSRIHADDLERVKRAISAQLDSDTEQFEIEYRLRRRADTVIWVRCHGVCIRDQGGTALRMVGSQIDITRQKAMEARLVHDALHDGLTGLPNRVLLHDRLAAAIRRMRHHPEHGFALLFIDLDRFKNINDSLGHAAGDELLVAISRRLADCLRDEDTLSRIGGDEFVVLANDPGDNGGVSPLVARIEAALERPIEVRGHELVTSASIGIATSNHDYASADEVLRDADIAMYRAKAAGRAGHAVFVGQMHAQAVKFLRLETDLRRALLENQCRTHYQPIVRLDDMELAGFESLARWNHPEHGRISPAEFIPIAEETGLIIALGEWSLRESCGQMRSWQLHQGAGLFMAVNLSPRQFSEPGLLDRVATILTETELPASNLKIEITEGVLIADVDRAAHTLTELRDLGVGLALDDFGTGYSSLSYLHRMPFHTLKVDRSFVMEMEHEQRARQLVEGIVTMAQALDLEVVAEGIESAAQLAMLRDLGCTYGQGYYLSLPLAADKAEEIVASPSFGDAIDDSLTPARRAVTLKYGEADPDFAAAIAELSDQPTLRYGQPMRPATRTTLRLLGELGEEVLAELEKIADEA